MLPSSSVPTVFLFLLLQLPGGLDYALLVVEDARGDPAPLIAALDGDDVSRKRQALRALGRFERPELARHVAPFLAASDPTLRVEAANALAQMGVSRGLAEALGSERDARVRAVLLASLGRSSSEPSVQAILAAGLEEGEIERLGAARGLEHYARRLGAEAAFRTETLAALRRAALTPATPRTRRLALEALARAGDAHAGTLERALEDSDAQVRRLAVRGLRRFAVDDPSHLVRYEALEAAFTCDAARTALADPSEHVVLGAVDRMAEGCDAAPLVALAIDEGDWRRGAHALVTLASIAPDEARARLPRFARHDVWQARVYAARAARVLGDEETLAALRRDAHPNVAAESLRSADEALDALRRYDDYGLLMKALGLLDGGNMGAPEARVVLDELRAVTASRRATSRDPRRLMLERLGEWGDPSLARELEPYLADFDPEIAQRAAEILSETTGRPAESKTRRFEEAAPPPRELLASLDRPRARVTMREAGPFTIELLPEEAPFTVARFVTLAERGYYDGLTFHRIVPNFVIQGGSPSANEYEGFPDYLRDEVGLVPHERGTLGISTRGRDTGDSQIFVNLVDNPRLDHAYTVFARVVEGMENVDRILEGDVMESVRVER